MHSRSFLPSPRAANVLIALGAAALGYALYLRYLVIENSTVGLACEAGLATSAAAPRSMDRPVCSSPWTGPWPAR